MPTTEWIGAALDVILILLVGAGLVQAVRLLRHLAGLRQGRDDMQRFVQEFSSTVLRAEAGIKGLEQAARESGDDLEKLIEKSSMIRDELHFLVESADQLAGRLSIAASAARNVEKPVEKPTAHRTEERHRESPQTASQPAPETVTPLKKPTPGGKPASRAEKELMQALEKLG